MIKILNKKVNESLNATYAKFDTQNSTALDHKFCIQCQIVPLASTRKQHSIGDALNMTLH